MAIKMEIDSVTGGKLGGTNYTMVEAKYNGVVVWPASASQYIIVPGTITLHFSAGNILYANGQNCVEYITANVQNTATGVVTQNVTLTPTLESGSAYYIGVGGSIWGPNLGTTGTSLHSESVTVTYQNASATVTIQQEANIRTVTRTDYGTWTETSRTPSGNPYDYHVSIAADRYTLATSSDKCPASGGSATLYFPSGTCYHIQDYNVTRTRTVTEYCTYTATGSTVHTEPQPNQTNSYTDYTQVTDTPTISGSATGFSRNGYNVTIENRGQIEGSARSVTYTATNNNVTDTVTIYQEKNEYIGSSSVYTVTAAFHDYVSPNQLPASGGSFRIDYVSTIQTTENYTSGTYPGEAQPLTSTVTADSNCSTTTNSVSGSGYYYISVGSNSGGNRTVQTTVRYDTNHYGVASLYQAGGAASIAAEFYPIVAGSTGTISLVLKIAQNDLSKVSWPVSVNDIVLGITVTGQSESQTTVFPQPLSFPQPPSLTPRESTVELTRILPRPSGESGTMRVVKTTNAPTSDQVTDFTCDSKSYSVMSQI